MDALRMTQMAQGAFAQLPSAPTYRLVVFLDNTTAVIETAQGETITDALRRLFPRSQAKVAAVSAL